MPRVGVLALQGAFEAHRKALAEAGAEGVEVRSATDLCSIEGLIIPGGESTTMLTLIAAEKLMEPLREFGERKPVFGTCAGAVLLAREVSHPVQASLGLMDIAVERNAYGRQVESRVARARIEPGFSEGDGSSELEAVFIRAPIIRRMGGDVRALARYNGDPVLVRDGRHMAATFHPELSADRRVHRIFMNSVTGRDKYRVLFVCLGNSCRSQMAEGFARTYGGDVIEAQSAGLSPAPLVSPMTQQVMAEKNIDLSTHFPKGIYEVNLPSFDLIVNISGYPFPETDGAPVRQWNVADPIGGKKRVHERVAQEVEQLVMGLVLELRREAARPSSYPPARLR